ncbi:hypothetical protein OIU84_026410 [Salix udensis]|uniref:Uncharacterized protein n=1 Tax=Salix udensis TaxID=889485 RepID=A0AAD6KM69_9ROSI|nr:hypothetical protein OIU84_026410 [Salix udensis]
MSEPSILRELIEAAPEIPDDFGKNTREMVALRCLEDLFCRSDSGSCECPYCKEVIRFTISAFTYISIRFE